MTRLTRSAPRRDVLISRIFVYAAAVFVICVPALASADATYTYSGTPFTIFVGSVQCPPHCRVTGSFTVATPLPANAAVFVEETYSFVDFSFTDGGTTFTELNCSFFSIYVETDAQGQITMWDLLFRQQPFGTPSLQLNNFPNGHPEDGLFEATFVDFEGFAETLNAPGTWSSSAKVFTLQVCSDASCHTPASNDLEVLPSRFPLPFIGCSLTTNQPKTVAFKVGCFDAHTGAPSANCLATLSIAPVPFSGGHDHDDVNRPPGTLDVTSGTTGVAGLPVTYAAPAVSGDVELSLSGSDSSGTPLLANRAAIHVQVKGLAELADGSPYYDLAGAKPEHENNHYSLPYVNAVLLAIAKDVSTDPAFSGVEISYNDQSLGQGGTFDLMQNWGPPHCGHSSLGGGTNNVDVSLVEVALQARFEKIIKKHGGRVCVKHPDHWHLCF